MLLGFEQANRYTIYDQHGESPATAAAAVATAVPAPFFLDTVQPSRWLRC